MKNAIVLGGIAAHKELISRLKEQGYYVILIDYLDNPPARESADLHLQYSTLDKEKVLEIAQKYSADLVTSGCVDQANITAAYVNEELGLYTPYSYETALKITNKGFMKDVMKKNGIPSAKFIYTESIDENDFSELCYPVIVKPADSNSANGVKKVHDKTELLSALKNALEISRNHKAIVEEFIEGVEFSAYFYVKDKKANLLMTNERLSVFDGKDKIIKCYASIMPARIPRNLNKIIENIGTKIAASFNFDNIPLFYQAIYKNDEIFVIEFAPRFGGGVSFYNIPHNTGFDLFGSIIASQRGDSFNIGNLKNDEYVSATNTVYANNCKLKEIKLNQNLDLEEYSFKFFPYKSPGSIIDNHNASSSRVGAFVIKTDNFDKLEKLVSEVFENLSVIDINGINQIRMELSLINPNLKNTNGTPSI